jgi:hypothetical protein
MHRIYCQTDLKYNSFKAFTMNSIFEVTAESIDWTCTVVWLWTCGRNKLLWPDVHSVLIIS